MRNTRGCAMRAAMGKLAKRRTTNVRRQFGPDEKRGWRLAHWLLDGMFADLKSDRQRSQLRLSAPLANHTVPSVVWASPLFRR